MFVKAIKKIFTSKKKSVEPVFATHHYDNILAYIDDLRKDPATGAPIPFTLNNGKKEFNSSTARVFPVARSEVRDAGTTSGPTPTSATKRPLPGPNIQTMSRPYRSPTNVTVVSPAITKNIRRVDTSNVKRFGGVPPAIASSIISNSKPTFTSSDSLAPSELAYMKESPKAIAKAPLEVPLSALATSGHQQTPRKRHGAVWWTVVSPNTSSDNRVMASEPELKESPKACPTLLPSSTPTAAGKRRDGVVWSSAVPPTTSSDNRVAPPAIASSIILNSKPTSAFSDSLAPSELAYMNEMPKAIVKAPLEVPLSAPATSGHQRTLRKRHGAVWCAVPPTPSSDNPIVPTEPEWKESPKACAMSPSSTQTVTRKRRDGVVWLSAPQPKSTTISTPSASADHIPSSEPASRESPKTFMNSSLPPSTQTSARKRRDEIVWKDMPLSKSTNGQDATNFVRQDPCDSQAKPRQERLDAILQLLDEPGFNSSAN
ncbi:hypothetical protein L218DRAFT_1075896 [Marasmius fiardii PR-910]|nr:hypothetical protein L218DRAFT_1075896 [Marasmius fiardii PR-910]